MLGAAPTPALGGEAVTEPRRSLMSLKGFSVPLSPEGRASLTPAPPWHYAGELLVVDFAADPAAVKAVLPPHLEPDPYDPGGCVAFFVAWQFASESGEEYLDPARSQYNEFILLVNALYRRPGAVGEAAGGARQGAGEAVSACYIYVDKDTSMARGWIQGWPKKYGEVHTTAVFPSGVEGGSPAGAGRAVRRDARGQRPAAC